MATLSIAVLRTTWATTWATSPGWAPICSVPLPKAPAPLWSSPLLPCRGDLDLGPTDQRIMQCRAIGDHGVAGILKCGDQKTAWVLLLCKNT